MSNGAVVLIIGVVLVFIIWKFCVGLPFRKIQVPEKPKMEESKMEGPKMEEPVIEKPHEESVGLSPYQICIELCLQEGYTSESCLRKCRTSLSDPDICGSYDEPYYNCMPKCISCGYHPSHCRERVCNYSKSHPRSPYKRGLYPHDTSGCGC